MTTQLDRDNITHLPHTVEAFKLRYGVFGSKGRHEVWIMRSSDPMHWTLINRFNCRHEARAAVDRYLQARQIAGSLGCRS